MAAAAATPTTASKHHVQGIKELVDDGLCYVPEKYIRPLDDRPQLSQVCHTEHVPIIDIAGLFGDGRLHVIQQIGSACKEWGFFQVINHGVSPSTIENVWAASRKFFEQPAEERMRYYSEDFNAEVAYVTSFNPSKEKIFEWKDVFYFRSTSGGSGGFKQAPSFCRDAIVEYLKEVRNLATQLYEAVFQSLGLNLDYLRKALPGIPREDEIGGLQVKRDQKWIPVTPVPEAFVVNIGDQIQLLTNGKYKSAEHRAVVNSEHARMSIACFFLPQDDSIISPLTALIDEKHPNLYKPAIFGEYMKNVFNKGLDGKSTIDSYKVE